MFLAIRGHIRWLQVKWSLQVWLIENNKALLPYIIVIVHFVFLIRLAIAVSMTVVHEVLCLMPGRDKV